MNTKTRDYLFDNYKALLIFLVVIGHFLEPCYENNMFLHSCKWLIFSFHMPAFIFISGFFSKKVANPRKAFQKLIVPYLAFECIYYLVYTFLIQKDTGLYLLYPKFSLWYLLALFVWKLITPYVKKIPHYFILSIIGGLAAGFLTIPGNFLTIPRILVFYPYFLAGTMLDRTVFDRFRKPVFQGLSFAGIVLFILYLVLDPFHKELTVKIFYGRYNYDFLDMSEVTGIMTRLLCYAIGFGLTFAFALLITEKKTVFSRLGQLTMPIYLFHGLIYNCVKDCTNWLTSVETLSDSLILILSCCLLTVLLSIKPLTQFTNAISSISLTSLGKRTGLYGA